MKKEYTELEIEVIRIDSSDVICTSSCSSGCGVETAEDE